MSILLKLLVSTVLLIAGIVIFPWLSKRFKRTDNIFLGLLLFIISLLVIELVSLTNGLEESQKSNAVLVEIINGIFQEGTTFSDFYYTALISNMRRGLQHKDIYEKEENAPFFWLKTVTHFEKSYYATSYIDPAAAWNLAYTRIGIEIQEAKVKQGARAHRVFIVDSEEELKQIMPIMKLQRQAGIDARYIWLEDIKKRRVLSKVELETLDFALIDGEFLLMIMLDENRGISHSILTREMLLYEKYLNFYTHLFNDSDSLSD